MPQFDRTALSFLLAHDYPGNVRELQNIVEGAVSLADGVVDVALIQSLMGGAVGLQSPEPLDLETVKRRHVRPGHRDDGRQQERRREASRRQQAHPDPRRVLIDPLSVHPTMAMGHIGPP